MNVTRMLVVLCQQRKKNNDQQAGAQYYLTPAVTTICAGTTLPKLVTVNNKAGDRTKV
jgi:hypothetical protein